jgi:hypothetical protein
MIPTDLEGRVFQEGFALAFTSHLEVLINIIMLSVQLEVFWIIFVVRFRL